LNGGAGFVGSHLVDSRLAKGFEVTVLDDFWNGKKENISTCLSTNALKLVRGDIRDAITDGLSKLVE
jgi:UDP-glucose 4-epimerase